MTVSSLDPDSYRLSTADHRLIQEAREAFRQDYRYLLDVLWQARAKPTATKPVRSAGRAQTS